MIHKIFSVRDNIVEAYLQPFFSANDGSSIRSLMEVVNDPNHTFSKHAADYTLWEIGSFDDSSGVLTGGDPRRMLALIELLKNPMT